MHYSPHLPVARSIIIRNMHRTSEHQMLEQMGKARMPGMFVTSTHVINNIQRQPSACWCPLCAPTAEPLSNIFLFIFIKWNDRLHHQSITVTFLITTSSSGRSLRSVLTFCILSTISIPSSTSPNTVYAPSKCGVPPTVV